jgi:uncharacterized protein (DUF302 family)
MAGYGMSTKLEGTIDAVKPRVVEALKSQGFGVLTEIDVQKTMQAKLGVEFKPYLILGACNPHFAYRSLLADEAMGLLLPCNVILRQDEDGVEVGIQDPEVMFSVIDEDLKQSMQGFPQEVKEKLLMVLVALHN